MLWRKNAEPTAEQETYLIVWNVHHGLIQVRHQLKSIADRFRGVVVVGIVVRTRTVCVSCTRRMRALPFGDRSQIPLSIRLSLNTTAFSNTERATTVSSNTDSTDLFIVFVLGFGRQIPPHVGDQSSYTTAVFLFLL